MLLRWHRDINNCKPPVVVELKNEINETGKDQSQICLNRHVLNDSGPSVFVISSIQMVDLACKYIFITFPLKYRLKIYLLENFMK